MEDWRDLDDRLGVINDWSKEFGIEVNPLKSGIIRLLKRAGDIKGIPNNMGIKEVKTYKYLGIWVDQSCNFKKQIS
jgi:hypothetical protein